MVNVKSGIFAFALLGSNANVRSCKGVDALISACSFFMPKNDHFVAFCRGYNMTGKNLQSFYTFSRVKMKKYVYICKKSNDLKWTIQHKTTQS